MDPTLTRYDTQSNEDNRCKVHPQPEGELEFGGSDVKVSHHRLLRGFSRSCSSPRTKRTGTSGGAAHNRFKSTLTQTTCQGLNEFLSGINASIPDQLSPFEGGGCGGIPNSGRKTLAAAFLETEPRPFPTRYRIFHPLGAAAAGRSLGKTERPGVAEVGRDRWARRVTDGPAVPSLPRITRHRFAEGKAGGLTLKANSGPWYIGGGSISANLFYDRPGPGTMRSLSCPNGRWLPPGTTTIVFNWTLKLKKP